jgi:hypothetical protein
MVPYGGLDMSHQWFRGKRRYRYHMKRATAMTDEEMIEMIEATTEWPRWPALPLKHRTRDAVGFILDEPRQFRVYEGNLYGLPRDGKQRTWTEAIKEAGYPVSEYATLQDLVAEWRVD